MAFYDFFVDASYIGEDGIKQIRSAYRRAYIEDTAQGLYISCSGFNPKGKSSDKNYRLDGESRLVANLIAKKAPKKIYNKCNCSDCHLD